MTTGSASAEDQIPPPRPPASGASRATVTGGLAWSACEPHWTWIEDLVRLKRNARAIYQDLVDQFGFPSSYQSVKRFVRTLRHSDPEQFDRLEFLPGEEAQVDYGEGALTIDPNSGRYRRPRLFVMTLRYSRRSFRLVVWNSASKSGHGFTKRHFDILAGCQLCRPRQPEGRCPQARSVRTRAQSDLQCDAGPSAPPQNMATSSAVLRDTMPATMAGWPRRTTTVPLRSTLVAPAQPRLASAPRALPLRLLTSNWRPNLMMTIPEIERRLRQLRLSGVRDTLQTQVLQRRRKPTLRGNPLLDPAGRIGSSPVPAYRAAISAIRAR
ncbi:hypothetical protein MPLSOD_180006 [Mesorhizobium sp. SOD10]|nr:hypothetical protein MPLSOD_180006 [Mesorhizobium sp. SOD10]